MTEQELSELSTRPWMQSRIPALDALSVFVPDAHLLDPVVEQTLSRIGFSRWYPVPGGHRVLVPYEGGAYDAGRFTIEPRAWDHETCKVCRAHIPAMTLCWVTERGPYIILCVECHERYVAAKQSNDPH